MLTISIQRHFGNLEDPRVLKKERHSLFAIITIAICAVICGADTWVDIEEFGKSKEEWFKTFLDIENGIPSHDTLGRVFSIIDAEEFSSCFVSWVQEIIEQTQGQVVAIDGKTVRRSHNQAIGKDAIHIVSAWATANGVVLGQRKVDGKSNEITAIPPLLDMLVLKGCIVTIDAIGAQKSIVKKITDKEADYVIALKENQKTLYREVQDTYEQAEKSQYREIEHTSHQTVEKDHGRIEKRECITITDSDYLKYLNPSKIWKNLRSISMVKSERIVRGKSSTEIRYYISSLTSAEKIAHAVRAHWGIENKLHWTLDVIFNEDQSRVRTGHADHNLSVLRRIALNLIKQNSSKGSVKTKRFRAALNQSFMLELLSHSL